jgi:RNA polymerase primary sigma factor
MRQLRITYQITTRDNDSLDRYLNEISRIPLIGPEEETLLAVGIRQGDAAALHKLVHANLRFVVSVAKQFQHQGMTLSDLINEGNMGLINAASKFDPSRGFKFISYAVWWVRQAIMQALLNKGRMIRVPAYRGGSYSRIAEARNRFEQLHERKPTNEELAELAGVDPDVLSDLEYHRTRPMSIDAPVSDEEDFSLMDVIEDLNSKRPDVDLQKESLKKEIESLLAILPAREADIVSGYYGMHGQTRMNLEDLGEKFNLTRERVRQIKERALKRMRLAAKSRVLTAYLE